MVKIKNSEALATTPLRELALKILEAGLTAIDTKEAIRSGIHFSEGTLSVLGKNFSLDAEGKLFVVCVGKCATDAARALEDIFGAKISGGVAIDIRCDETLEYIESCEGDHPFPTERNIDATKKIIKLLEGITEKDTVLFVISGGGSTLLCQPENHTCQDERLVVEGLFEAGAGIIEINTIRKHLSLARGGYLAKYSYPAQVISLIFSDVVGNDFQFIASGPTLKDETTVEEAKKIFEKYADSMKCLFHADNLFETPKEEKYFKNVSNILLVSNETALEAMKKEAKRFGFSGKICSSCLTGEARVVGRNLLREIESTPSKTALFYGGETTVRIEGKGKGGRNQELSLSALKELSQENVIITSLASDGWDNSPSAGALCDMLIKKKAEEEHFSIEKFLENNDSFTFFETVGGKIESGPTGSNVADLVLALKGE